MTNIGYMLYIYLVTVENCIEHVKVIQIKELPDAEQKLLPDSLLWQ